LLTTTLGMQFIKGEDSLYSTYESNKQIIDDAIGKTISELNVKRHCFIPGGWNTHAMLYEFKITDNGDLLFIVHNTGAGLEKYHQTFPHKNEDQYYPIKVFRIKNFEKSSTPETRDKDLKNLNDFLKLLFSERFQKKLGEVPQNHLYEQVISKVAILSGVEVTDLAQLKEIKTKTTSGQVSGNCTQAVLYSLIYSQLDDKIADKILYEYKKQSLDKYSDIIRERLRKLSYDDTILDTHRHKKDRLELIPMMNQIMLASEALLRDSHALAINPNISLETKAQLTKDNQHYQEILGEVKEQIKKIERDYYEESPMPSRVPFPMSLTVQDEAIKPIEDYRKVDFNARQEMQNLLSEWKGFIDAPKGLGEDVSLEKDDRFDTRYKTYLKNHENVVAGNEMDSDLALCSYLYLALRTISISESLSNSPKTQAIFILQQYPALLQFIKNSKKQPIVLWPRSISESLYR